MCEGQKERSLTAVLEQLVDSMASVDQIEDINMSVEDNQNISPNNGSVADRSKHLNQTSNGDALMDHDNHLKTQF